MKPCINCRRRPQGIPRIGITPSGGVFVSKACDVCQGQVDREIARLKGATTMRHLLIVALALLAVLASATPALADNRGSASARLICDYTYRGESHSDTMWILDKSTSAADRAALEAEMQRFALYDVAATRGEYPNFPALPTTASASDLSGWKCALVAGP